MLSSSGASQPAGRGTLSSGRASQPGLGTEDDAEIRIASDGQPYTRLQFKEHYGDDWHGYWETAWIVAVGQQPPQAAPTNAGAPQPGAILDDVPWRSSA